MKNSSKQSVKMDMLHGSLFDKMLMFAMPLAACSILQQLFNSVDTAVVGNFASSQALAAVGSNSSLIALMINLFIGISLGSNYYFPIYRSGCPQEYQSCHSHCHCCSFGRRHFPAGFGPIYCKTGSGSDGHTG